MTRGFLIASACLSVAAFAQAPELLGKLDQQPPDERAATISELDALARTLKTRDQALAAIARAVDDPKRVAATSAPLLLLAVDEAVERLAWDRAGKLLERARAAADDEQLIAVHLAWARVEATRGRFESARNHLAAIDSLQPGFASDALLALQRWVDGPLGVTMKIDVAARRATITLANRSQAAWSFTFTREARTPNGFPGKLTITVGGRLFAVSETDGTAKTTLRLEPGKDVKWVQALEPGFPARGVAELELPLIGTSADGSSAVREPLRARFPFP